MRHHHWHWHITSNVFKLFITFLSPLSLKRPYITPDCFPGHGAVLPVPRRPPAAGRLPVRPRQWGGVRLGAGLFSVRHLPPAAVGAVRPREQAACATVLLDEAARRETFHRSVYLFFIEIGSSGFSNRWPYLHSRLLIWPDKTRH